MGRVDYCRVEDGDGIKARFVGILHDTRYMFMNKL